MGPVCWIGEAPGRTSTSAMALWRTGVITLALVTLATLAGCQTPGPAPLGQRVVGSGHIVTKIYDPTDFDRVEVENDFTVEVSQSTNYRVFISADDNLFDFIRANKEGRTLRIALDPDRIYHNVTVEARIGMPSLSGLKLANRVQATIGGFKSARTFDVDVSGHSRLGGRVEARDTAIRLSGASVVTLDGSGTRLRVDGTEGSQANLEGYRVEDASIHLSGRATATVNASDDLDADLSDGSTLIYVGNPSLGRVSTTGGSSLSRK